MASRPRIVIVSPHAVESAALAEWLLAEGFEPVKLASLLRAADDIRTRTFDLLITDFAFAFRQSPEVFSAARSRNAQTPIVIIGEPDASAESQVLSRGAMYLSRPLDQASLICTVSMAVMESRPMRRSVRKPVNRYDVIVEGTPAHIIDVSNEGMRLEIPRGRKSAPPPFFTVQVPMLGIALMVRRMWSSSIPNSPRDAALYGGELSTNSPRAERVWRAFVDAIPAGGARLEVQ